MQFNTYDLSLKDDVETFTKQLFYALFNDVCQEKENHLKRQFLKILNSLSVDKAQEIWMYYQTSFCEIRKKLDFDAKVFEEKDPACKSLVEVYFAYPGFHAIAIYRLSHELYKINVPVLPRMMSEYAHGITGVDIHPGATIGEFFFIDHATGVVIGETTVIQDKVSIYQGVTLGGIQVEKDLAEVKRHPTIENNVTIYANATILGNITVGKNSVIGANVCITKSIESNATVIYKSQNSIYT